MFRMTANGQFAAELVSSGATGLAAITVQKLFERRADAARRFGPGAAATWRESTCSRLGYLAAALSTGNPTVFATQVAWARTAHEARGGAEAGKDLIECMHALKEVLAAELPADAGRLAAEYVEIALKRASKGPAAGASDPELRTPQRQLVAEYLLALLEGDRRRACKLVLDALDGRSGAPALSVVQIYNHVLIPAQVELGRMWHLNEVGVAEEHFATATTQLVMSLLYPRLPASPPNGKVVVAGSVEGNAHDIGIRMIGDMLESAGWRTVYLGASVPGPDLAQAVEHFGADLAALSAGLGSQLPAVVDAISRIRALERPVKILVGGRAFAADETFGGEPLWVRIGADGYATSLEQAVTEAARLLQLPK